MMTRLDRRAALILLTGLGVLAPAVRPALHAGAPAPQRGVVAGPGDGLLERRLTDGRLLRLAGLEPGPGPWADRLDEALGRALPPGTALAWVARGQDRYGSEIALPWLDHGADAPGALLQADLLAAGLAWAWPEAECIDAHDALLQVERAARAARAGLWGDPRMALPLPAEGDAPESWLGRPSLWRGTVRRADPKQGWLHCDFGDDWRRDATVSIPARLIRAIKARGLDAETLPGLPVEARGVPIWRFGPAMELWHDAQVQVVEDPAT